MSVKKFLSKAKDLAAKGKEELVKIVNDIAEDEERDEDILLPWESEYLDNDIRIKLKNEVLQIAYVWLSFFFFIIFLVIILGSFFFY
jgi:hypothetical protein